MNSVLLKDKVAKIHATLIDSGNEVSLYQVEQALLHWHKKASDALLEDCDHHIFVEGFCDDEFNPQEFAVTPEEPSTIKHSIIEAVKNHHTKTTGKKHGCWFYYESPELYIEWDDYGDNGQVIDRKVLHRTVMSWHLGSIELFINGSWVRQVINLAASPKSVESAVNA